MTEHTRIELAVRVDPDLDLTRRMARDPAYFYWSPDAEELEGGLLRDRTGDPVPTGGLLGAAVAGGPEPQRLKLRG